MSKSNLYFETNHRIFQAISELMDEIPVNKITVTKVCERAEINRSTFYDHFKSIDDVIPLVNQDIIKEFTRIMTENSSINDKFLTELFSFIYNNKEGFANYYQLGNRLSFTNYFQVLYEEFRIPNGRFVALCWDAGLNSLIKSWLLEHDSRTPSDLVNIFTKYLANKTKWINVIEKK